MRKLTSKASPLPTTRAHSISTLTRSSGCTCSSQPRPELLRFAAAGVVDPLPAEVVAVAVARAGPDHLRQRFGQRLEARAALAQRLDRLAVLGDVDAGADETLELARRAEVRRAALEQPAPGAIVALQPELHFVGPARIEGRVIGVEHAIEIGRVQVVAPAIAQFLFDGASDEVQPALVEPGAALVGAAHPDEHRRGIRRGAETAARFRAAPPRPARGR